MGYVIGLDIGTTSTIGILIDPRARRVIAKESRPVTLYAEHAGWAEEDPLQWWENLRAICQKLVAEVGAERISAVGVAGMVPAVVLLDAAGQLLRRSIQQSDGRCEAEVAALKRETDAAAFLARTGNGINQQLVLAKLRWLANHEPEAFSRIGTVFGSYDYIAHRLTGARRVERNWALEGGFLDLASGQIAPDLCALGGIAPRLIPPLINPTEVTGRITAQAALDTGLPEGVRVIGGVADHVASAYAAGLVAPGRVLLKFGGAGDVLAAADAARPDARLFMDFHPVPGLFMPNGCMASTGSMLNWAATLLAPSEAYPHRRLDALAAAIPAQADLPMMLPYMLGEKSPIHDPQARGVFAGLTLGHSTGHIWRAALIGAAYAFRHHVEVFDELGYRPEQLLASDGGSASAVWMQIVADIHQMPVQVLAGHPGSCLGAAWLAAMGTGLAHYHSGVTDFVTQGPRYDPDPALAAHYGAGYRRFRALYTTLQPWFRADTNTSDPNTTGLGAAPLS
jgi:xylulokinase